jgi:DNA repair protein RadC
MEKIYEIQRIKQVVQEVEARHIIRCPEDAARVAAHFIGDDDREVFFVMCLNTKNEVVAVHRCHIGSLNASIVHPREVFKAAILNNAASIIVAHQHPSGDVTPSKEDVEMTRRLAEAGRILGIEVLDHLVINYKAEYTSLKERGFFS